MRIGLECGEGGGSIASIQVLSVVVDAKSALDREGGFVSDKKEPVINEFFKLITKTL